jgi:hypothetical protein
MKMAIGGFKFAEISLIGIMSLCGTLAFTSSKIYESLCKLILLHLSPIAPYSSLIIWGLLLILGVLTITITNKGAGVFTALVMIFSLPSILNFDSLDLPRLFHLRSVGAEFSSTFNFYEILGLGIGIIICYLLINFMSILKKSRGSLITQGATLSDVDFIYSRGHLVLVLVMGIALIIAMTIAVFTRGIELLLLPSVIHWNLVLVGLICITLIATYIYWLVSRRKHIS